MDKVFNKNLIARFAELKRDGTVEKQKDIAEKLGFKEPTVSSYLNGKVKASRNFLDKFDEVFGLQSRATVADIEEMPIGLTEGKTAILKYPRSRLNSSDVEILKITINAIGISVSDNPKGVQEQEELGKKNIFPN